MAATNELEADGGAQQADYGIVTALRDELTALRAVLGTTEEVQLGERDIRFYYRSRVKCQDGSVVVVVCACANDMGQTPALNVTRDLIAAWRPRHLLLVGIAGGFPGRGGSYGDVVAPLQVHYYEPGKLVIPGAEPHRSDTPRVPRWRVFRGSAKLHAAVEALAIEEEQAWVRRIKVDRPDGVEGAMPKILRADLASGEEVWASLESAIAREVFSHSDKILGVETEAAGFLSAVEECPDPPDALVIKAFSDLVEGKDDRWRAFSAMASAAFAVTLIEKIGTRYGGASAALAEKGKEQLKAAWKALDDLDYQSTARLAEEAAELARQARDGMLESRARRQAVRAWGDYLATARLSDHEAAAVVSRIREHLQVLEERLDISPAHLAVEKARLNLFEGCSTAAIELAEEALRITEEGTTDWVDALLFATHAYWQQNKPEEALASLGELLERARSAGDLQTRLVAAGALLRTRWKARSATVEDVSSFCAFVRQLVANEGLERKWALLVLQEIDGELGRGDASQERLIVCELALDLATELEDASRAAGIALEAAELAAVAGLAKKARHYLGKAASWAELAKTAAASAADTETWQAIYLFSRGRILFRLAGHPWTSAESESEPIPELLREALDVLEKAEALALDKRPALNGDIELYLADVRWWSARTAFELNRFTEAASLSRLVRSDAAMAHPRFSAEVGLPAWLLEAEALYLGGDPEQALTLVDSLRQDPRATGAAAERARAFSKYLTERIQPLLGWLRSGEAAELAQKAKRTSVRETIAEQLQPLLRWWKEWESNRSGTPYSEFLDFWARGGFLRTAAAVRSRPTSAIAVDAWSVDEIRLWARVFCPLFDTVVVKWKGEIGQGMVITPMAIDYGGPGCFGGHGYSVTSDFATSPEGNRWAVALGWANPLPQEVASFLAREALPLFQRGRLLVVGAPLVGSTQTAVGWTDHLLVDGLLGGVVNVVGAGERAVRGASSQRVLDLSVVSLPYIDGVPLSDLAMVLDELAEWLDPLRSLLLKSVLSQNLRRENWQAIAAIESDIRAACRQLRDRLQVVTKPHQWRVAEANGSFAAGSRGTDALGHEPITDVLRAIAGGHELAPWIPYWRLQAHGGYLDWVSPIDNPSKPSPKPQVPRTSQTWLWPGTGGWGFPTAIRLN